MSETAKKKKSKFWKGFWLSFLVISLGYAWYSFYVPPNDVLWAKDFATAQEVASQTDKPMLIFFTADWCVPCRVMKRQVFADKEVMEEINGRFVPVMLYQNLPENDGLFNQYNVKGTPVTILTNATGEVLNYAVGGLSKAEFLSLIQTI